MKKSPNKSRTCRVSPSTSLATDDTRSFVAPQKPDDLLKRTPSTLRTQPVYAYIVTTIKTTSEYRLEQSGCGPNFNGGRISLCTCKRKDRATFFSCRQDDRWKNVWVAGLTSKRADPPRSLAYLMCVERSFLNQRALWRHLPSHTRRAKSASKSTIGDLYEPKATAKDDPHNPACYNSPIKEHVHSFGDEPSWNDDIKEWCSRPHHLLLGQTAQSYRWVQVKIILKENAMGASAHHRIYPSLIQFIKNLQEFDS